jgi:hypothetical protein
MFYQVFLPLSIPWITCLFAKLAAAICGSRKRILALKLHGVLECVVLLLVLVCDCLKHEISNQRC